MSAYIFERAYDRNVSYERVRWGMDVETAHRMHVADLQTWADVQMAGAFGRLFFLLPHQQLLSCSSPPRTPSYLPAPSIPGHFSFASHQSSETSPAVSFLRAKIAFPFLALSSERGENHRHVSAGGK